MGEALHSLSLKSRLMIVFSGLMMLAVSFSVLLLYQQHRLAVRGASSAIEAHSEMADAVKVRDVLSEIDRYAHAGEIRTAEIAQFRKLIAELQSRPNLQSREAREIFARINDRFLAFVDALASNNLSSQQGAMVVRGAYDDVVAALSSFIEMNQNSVYRFADNLRLEQERSIIWSVSFLSAFILLMVFASFKIITIITSPFSSLVRFLDQVDVEDDLPSTLPDFHEDAPEISSVARSFERLLQRLRGYRALNVRRLLIEKRRADIIAASIADGILLLRGDEILYLNPTAEKILGIKQATLPPGMSLSRLVNPDDKRPQGAKAILNAISRTMPVDFVIQSEDRKAHYLIQAYPISYDVIERAENSMAEAIDPLTDKFQANTLVLAQDVTLVRESQEAKSHFLGTLSHEVKTPVTSLTMATRLLRKSIDQVENPTHRALILTCAEDVDRLRILIDDLLTVSRFDTLTQKLELKHTDLVKLLKHSVQSFQVQAAERGVQIGQKVSAHGKPVMVPMDPAKIAWAISNLLTNALRHTPRGGNVEAMLTTSEDWVEIRVKDTGPGIDRTRQDRIFDKFNPFYDIRVARSGSAGVGLAIAREIVVAHGGRIWVLSEPGHGAEFCFTLPMKRNHPETKSGLIPSSTLPKGAISGTSARS